MKPIGISIKLIKRLIAAGVSDDDIQEIINASCGVRIREKKKQTHWHPPEKEWWPLRAKILNRDDFTCAYCGVRELPKPYKERRLHEKSKMCVDHVVPLSRGGTNDESNLVCACFACNSSKCDKLLSEWEGRWIWPSEQTN